MRQVNHLIFYEQKITSILVVVNPKSEHYVQSDDLYI